jgi:hypothetical protein
MKLPLLLLPLLATAVPAQSGAKAPAKSPGPAPAPAPSSGELDAAVRIRIEVFFKHLQEGRIEEGYGRLFEGATLVKEQPELVTNLVKNTSRVIDISGRIESAAILRVRSAGKTLREVTAIMNCGKRPVRWLFYVYFGEGKWQVVDTDLDMEIASFFEEESRSGKN